VGTSPDPLPHRGPGVVLRRLGREDLADFQAYRHDPAVGRFQGWSPMSDEHALQFLSEMHATPLVHPGHWTQIGIAEPDTQRLIGDIGLFVDEAGREAEVGFSLARHAQGRGLATAAVRAAIGLVLAASPVEQVLGITDARNAASIRVLERLGMRRTAIRHTVFRGEACEEHVYALLRVSR
jgi:aminoglycoside 6'-N-acetyltransferase